MPDSSSPTLRHYPVTSPEHPRSECSTARCGIDPWPPRQVHLQVQVEVRPNVFGRDLVDPANDAARTFTSLTGRATFTARDLRLIRQLGYTVVMRQESARLPDGFGDADII